MRASTLVRKSYQERSQRQFCSVFGAPKYLRLSAGGMATRGERVDIGLRSRRVLTLLGTILVVAIGAMLAVQTVDVGTALAALRGADPWLVAAGVFTYALSWPLRGRRYDDILGAMGHRCGLTFLTAATFFSQTANLAFPARAGDGARAYVVKARREVPYATGAASLAVERLFDLVAIVVLGGIGFTGLALAGELPGLDGTTGVPVWGVLALAVVSVGGLATIVGLARSERFAAAVGSRADCFDEESRLAAIVDALLRFGGSVRVVAADGRALATVGVGSLVVWLLDVLTAVLVLAAVGTGLSVPLLLAVGTLAVSVGNLAKVLPLSQGGIGLYEGAFTAVIVAITPVGAGLALAGALLDHALKNLVTLAGGGFAAFWLNLSPTLAAE